MHARWIKGSFVVVGAVLLSTLGIYASDALQGIEGGIGQLAGARKAGVCMEGAMPITVSGRVLCVDVYEASPSEKCPHTSLMNVIESEENAKSPECYAMSVSGKVPWNYISLPQAQRVCANMGKRLPTSEEWYQIALGTNPDACVTNESTVALTGSAESCISDAGAHDVVGNLWEWVHEEVVGNTYSGRQLPEEGYVTSVDAQGIAVTSGESPDDLYGKDYMWSKTEGVFGMVRGGFYGSKDDAGLYAVNASVQASFATQGVGFRCVKDVF